MRSLDWALPLIVVAPLLAFALVATLSASRGGRPPERPVVAISKAASLVLLVGAGVALALVVTRPSHTVVFHIDPWLETPGRPAMLVLDGLSAPLLGLTALLSSVVGFFSASYLHRERGHSRFYVLYNLFVAGMVLLSLAGSLELFFVGWELVGLTSVLLIAFFHERVAPVRHGLRALAIYRACDVGLLLAVIVGADAESGATAGHDAFAVGGAHATMVGFFLLFAAMGKSAQLPVGGWLPRAMEGPTPSSAIFYGALSVHAGVYLLARTAPWMHDLLAVRAAIVVIGLSTSIYATVVGRVQSDVKNGLAYATMTQVGIMFVEIGAGFPKVAIVHMVGHACLRTWQLLRAPSILREMQGVRHALGAMPPRVGGHWERLVPERFRDRLYASALHGFFMDDLLDAVVVRPLAGLARAAVALERSWLAFLSGGDRERRAAAPRAPTDDDHDSAHSEVGR
jgi:NADH-quinone oxidoreductase subunit L